jgi:hypothetical protein
MLLKAAKDLSCIPPKYFNYSYLLIKELEITRGRSLESIIIIRDKSIYVSRRLFANKCKVS